MKCCLVVLIVLLSILNTTLPAPLETLETVVNLAERVPISSVQLPAKTIKAIAGMGKELRNGGTLSGAVKIGAKAAVENSSPKVKLLVSGVKCGANVFDDVTNGVNAIEAIKNRAYICGEDMATSVAGNTGKNIFKLAANAFHGGDSSTKSIPDSKSMNDAQNEESILDNSETETSLSTSGTIIDDSNGEDVSEEVGQTEPIATHGADDSRPLSAGLRAFGAVGSSIKSGARRMSDITGYTPLLFKF